MRAGVGSCSETDPLAAGRRVAEEAQERGGITRPDLVLAFCGGALDPHAFWAGLRSVLGPEVPILGGSAIGTITASSIDSEGRSAGAAVLQSDALRCEIASTDAIDASEETAGRRLREQLAARLPALPEPALMLCFYDSVRASATASTPPVLNTSGRLLAGLSAPLPLFGAGLVGDYSFGPTWQFCGGHVARQSAVVAALAGGFVPYARIMHGCTPLDGVYHRITRMDGAAIFELDGRPIVPLLDEIYGSDAWQRQHPVDVLTLGVNHGARYDAPQEGCYVNRLITGVLPGGIGVGTFEPDLTAGTEIQFMLRDGHRMIESARENSEALLAEIAADGRRPAFALYIDCAGRTAARSSTLTEEAAEVQEALARYGTPLLGFYSGVEIAPLLAESRGLDWTGVLLVLAVEGAASGRSAGAP